MKKRLKYIGIITLIFLIITGMAYIPVGNNIILLKYTNELKNSKLNADYEILTSDDECGKLIGNGNGMQYFSALLIHSKENLEWENNNEEGIFLTKVNDASFVDFIDEFHYGNPCESINKKLEEIKRTENYYILYAFYNTPLDSIWNNDLRAH